MFKRLVNFLSDLHILKPVAKVINDVYALRAGEFYYNVGEPVVLLSAYPFEPRKESS